MFVFLTTADTEIQALAAAVRRLPDDFAPVRARNANELQQPAALDRFVAEDLPRAERGDRPRPGGPALLRRGVRAALARVPGAGHRRSSRSPGEQALDPELTSLCHAPLPLVTQVLEYFTQGGVPNLVNLLRCLSDNVLLTGLGYEPPTPLPRDGLYHPDAPDGLSLGEWRTRFAKPGRPTVGILFYRAHWMAQNLAPIDALVRRVEELGGNAYPDLLLQPEGRPRAGGGRPGRLPPVPDRRARAQHGSTCSSARSASPSPT